MVNPSEIKQYQGRDTLLTDFAKATLKDRYLLPDETFQGLFARVSAAYANDLDHAQRLYDYMSKLWFMPATPILSNGGTDRGLPISCFVTEVEDNLEDIARWYTECLWLTAKGGGLGGYVGHLRSIGEKVGISGKTSGIISFLKVLDAQTLSISQGNNRRGSAAVYLDCTHPEIIEFIEMRNVSGGDPNRRCPNLNTAVILTDKFMEAVEKGSNWNLISPKDGNIIKTLSARDLWIRILTTRLSLGEPYILYIDTVNKAIPDHHKQLGLKVKTSQLCAEIVLPTGVDHLNNHRTAVCCLSSLNLEHWKDFRSETLFFKDIMRFLDNVLQSFIDKAPHSMDRAKYSAMRERSIGLGVMGYHSYLQDNSIPFGSPEAKAWNKEVFIHIHERARGYSKLFAACYGACPDAEECGVQERFSNTIAVAPTASISIIAGTSPSVEPFSANAFLHKTLSGSFPIRNKHLQELLINKGQDTPEVWESIIKNKGSVKHLTFLSAHEKEVFKTSFEIDQNDIIDSAADRQPFICQSQSINLFLPSDISKKELHNLHFSAWKKGLKSLYYCRSLSLQRAEGVCDLDEKECSSCQ